MLNEIMEYRQYTDINDCCRLIVKLKKSKIKPSGLKRALTIIAREFYYSDCFPESFGNKEKVNCTKDALRVWLGVKALQNYNDKPEIAEKLGFLDRHSFLQACMFSLNNTSYAESAAIFPNVNEYFTPEIDCTNSEKSTDYRNKILIDNVIANAITDGPLKKYYLVCKKSFNEIELKDLQRDAVLKGMSAYLLNRIDNQITAQVVKTDLDCWVSASTFDKAVDKIDFRPFVNVSPYNDASRWLPDRRFLDCDFKLIDSEDAKDVERYFNNENYCIFADFGYNKDPDKSLKNRVKYEQ